MQPTRWLDQSKLQSLIDLLRSEGFRVMGPTVDQQAILYDEITSVLQLPQGWSDKQSPALYQISKTPSGSQSQKYFHFNLGPHSWKKYLFPPHAVLAGEQPSNPQTPDPPIAQPLAIFGARACELAAIAIQDRVFLSGPYVDSDYALRRNDLFIVAVQCTTAANTCFCSSMNTGPALPNPEDHPLAFDLALTELILGDQHGFLIQSGSNRGQSLVDQLQTTQATQEMLDARAQTIDQLAANMPRSMPSGNLREPLMARLNHPHWQDIAKRCLSCANCTMVCPTCFCSSVDEVHDLVDDTIVRQRRWDSCFNPDFSHTSGAPVRNTISSRYRQWLTHKLATWHDQFDTSGCVGCGRCITWCPVGIDLTQEVAKLLEN
jgi:ferredoxin